eukprot:s1903_g2.t1
MLRPRLCPTNLGKITSKVHQVEVTCESWRIHQVQSFNSRSTVMASVGWATSPPGSSASGASRGAPNHLDSIKRGWDYHPEEHRNLPPTGLPSSAQTLAPSGSASPPGSFSSTQPLLAPGAAPPPVAPVVPGGGSNVRISVPQLFDGRLGLIIQNCWISAISNPQAAQYGWQVGDHILQVNGHPVSNMQQLSEEIRRAMNSHQAVSHPLIFDVFRSSAPAAPSAPSGRKERWDCCNVCDFTDSAPVSGYGGPVHVPPAYGGPMPAPQVARKQRFECCGADDANGKLPIAAAPPAPTQMQAPCAPYPGMVPRRRALC